MASIGIDLGKYGGAVALADNGALLAWGRTPLLGKEYDGHKMAALLRSMLDACQGERVHAFVESPAVFGLMSTQAMAVGVGAGRWMQVLEMLGIGYEFVYAQTWVPVFVPKPKRQRPQDGPKETAEQKMARRQRDRKESKERLMIEARRRHPTGIPWDSLNLQVRSGVADALLLAEFGRLRR